MQDNSTETRVGSSLQPDCYALVGTRTKDGKEETFRSPSNPEKWYRLTNAERLMEVMKRDHPSWTWKKVSA
jgi:hypothetical protein